MNETAAAYQSDQEAQRIFDTLRALPPGRVYAGLRSNWGESLKIDQVPMYRVLTFEGLWTVSVPLPSIVLNSEFSFHFDDRNPAFYELYDVRYVVAPRGLAMPDFLSPLLSGQRHVLYSLPDASAAMFASSTVERGVEDKIEHFYANRAWLLGPDMPARSFIRWNYPAAPAATTPPTITRCADGTISGEMLEAARIRFDTSCGSASTVVIKTTFHPNWRVTVDGVEQPTFMVSPSYIGVDVPGGTHRIEATYRSSMLRTVLLFAGIGAFAMVIVGRRVLARRRATRTVATHGALSLAFEDAPSASDASLDSDQPRT